jgi:tRNA threonylcarbamoyladenosine biosynthesis protein TsaE
VQVSAAQKKIYKTASPQATRDVAAGLVGKLPAGAVLALHGELGAGKTCFVQGLAQGLDVTRAVNSPTFTLVNEYPGRMRLYHIDLYRIHDADEAFGIGIEEYMYGNGITAIEWAERVEELLPVSTVHIYFDLGETEHERVISVHDGVEGVTA